MNDPRIAKIYDAWTENGCYCCSMEFIDGITYEKWLEENHDMDKRINILSEIFETIVLYQSQGIIHGDIHSRNILIDKEQQVHIIDFGTSSLSSYKEQSNYRENLLMYELVEKTLGNRFDNQAFLLKKYDFGRNVEKFDDIRNAVPIFFSKSVLSYLHLLFMLTNLHNIINEPKDIYEYCRCIAKGFYLNMDYFYDKVSGENKQKLKKFTNIMFESLEDEIYEECQEDVNKMEMMEFLSLFVYFREIKKGLLNGKIKEEIMEKYISERYFSEPQKIIDIINASNDLFDFHNTLIEITGDAEEVYLIELDLRGCMYSIIKEIYKGYLLHILRDLHLHMEWLKYQKGMCDKLSRLSPAYCFNSGILD